jgi:hypothetical protein
MLDEAQPSAERERIALVKLLRIAALAAVAVLLAGCGGGGGSGGDDNGVADKSATEIVAASKTAAQGADSVRVQGDIKSDNQTVSIDLRVASEKGATGNIKINDKQVDIVVIGDNAYLHADDAFWTEFGGGLAVAKLINGRWIKAPTSNPAFSQFTSFTDMDGLFESALGDTSGTIEKGDETTVNGTSAIELTDDQGSLFVATEGEPFPLKIESSGGEGALNFTEWNEAFDLNEPEDAVDISTLPGLGG